MKTEAAKILVVEDEGALAELYAEWLRDTHETMAVRRGEAALDLVDATLDIVLLDRHLPDIDVDEFLDRLHATGGNPQVAIIAGNRPGLGVLDLDIADYRVKPITKTELLELVQDLLSRRSMSQRERELTGLRAIRTALKAHPCDPAITSHPKFQNLTARIEELRPQTVDGGNPLASSCCE